MRLVARRFHLYRHNLVAVQEKKIRFIKMIAAFRQESVIVKIIACTCKHLGNQILIDVTQVDIQLVAQQLTVYHIVGERLVSECESNEQPRISDKHLIAVQILGELKIDVRVAHVVSHCDGLTILQFSHSLRQPPPQSDWILRCLSDSVAHCCSVAKEWR